MNPEKFTQKSLDAIQEAQNFAIRSNNSELKQAHLVRALLTQDDGLIPQVFTKMDIDTKSLLTRLERIIAGYPKVSGDAQQYISPGLNKAMLSAEDEAKAMQDDYISVEHLMLGILNNPEDEMRKLFSDYQISKKEYEKAVKAIRGASRVTSNSPEDTYNVLEKYGQDLTALARDNKLDPVIGRDDEIRNVIRILSRKTKNNPVLIG